MKCTFFASAVRSSHCYCLCLLAGMAKLHPEECRSSLYRVGQWGQVSDTTYSFISSLFAISCFPVSPVLHHFMDPSLNLFSSGDWVALYDSGLGWGGSMIAGGRLNWSLGEWGWMIFEFKSPFNICPSQWDFGRWERLGRRWEGFWSLVSLTHGKWLFISSCPSVSVCLSGLSTCSYLCCLSPSCVFVFFKLVFHLSPDVSLHFSL